jgi:hypothetical protein
MLLKALEDVYGTTGATCSQIIDDVKGHEGTVFKQR